MHAIHNFRLYLIYHQARLILETLREELAGLYMPPVGEDQDVSFRLASGVDGSVELVFDTLSPAWKRDSVASQIVRVHYVFTKDKSTGTTILQRVQQFWAGENPVGLEETSIVTADLSSFALQALVSGDTGEGGNAGWKASYESKDKPPRAVKVQLCWDLENRREQLNFESDLWVSSEASLQPKE